jgi:hypothetical protein
MRGATAYHHNFFTGLATFVKRFLPFAIGAAALRFRIYVLRRRARQ